MDEIVRYFLVPLTEFIKKYKIRDGYYEIPIEIFIKQGSLNRTQAKYEIENLLYKAKLQDFEIYVFLNYNYSKIIIKEKRIMRKSFYIEFPYMKREKYHQLLIELQNIISEEGMIAVAISNIANHPESAFIVECVNGEEVEVETLLKKYELESRVDRGFDEVISELNYNKWLIATIPIEFRDEELIDIFESMFEYPSDLKLEKIGVKLGNSKKRRQVFISYSHKDKDIVRQFVDELRESGVNAFIDYRSIDYGENILDSIMNGIDESDINIPFISENYKDSSYAKMELLTVWDRFVRDKSGWIIVKLDDINPDKIKPGLSCYKYFEFNNNSEELITVIKRKINSLKD